MTEQDLINMGFNQKNTDDNDYYYSFDIGGMTLITNECKSETSNDVWSIDVFDNDTFQFTNALDVMELISILERNIKK
jgi:hypothetical protein